jgi:hypothetical protein
VDSNFRFRATASSVIAIAGCAPENRFASDLLRQLQPNTSGADDADDRRRQILNELE